jgi:hypothetical protein
MVCCSNKRVEAYHYMMCLGSNLALYYFFPLLSQFAENQLSGPIPEDLVNSLVNLHIFSVHNREEGRGKHNGTIPRFDHHPYLAEI